MIDLSRLEEKLQKDMEVLQQRLQTMSDLVQTQLAEAVRAFLESDRKLAYRVVIQDHKIDVLEQHIDRLGQEFLVRHMPVARHLRFVVAALKANSELERVGDYAEAIARRAVTLAEEEKLPEIERIAEMARLSFAMLKNAMEAFLAGDADQAIRTLEADSEVDRLNSSIYADLAQRAGSEAAGADFTVRFALLGVVNRIERVADRACNIAEEAVYVVRGDVLRHLPKQDMRVLFLCDRNSCRSQMAEGIARSIAPGNFLFSSAGALPAPLDEKAVAFLATKGIDISRHRSKGIDEVGAIEDFHVVVTLSQRAEEACPPVPWGAVALDWNISDPSKVEGPPEEIQAAYEEIYAMLTEKINEMAEGLIGAFEREDEA